MLASVPVLPQTEGMSHYRQHGVAQQVRVQSGQQPLQHLMQQQPHLQLGQQRDGYMSHPLQPQTQQPQHVKTAEEEDDVTAIPVVRSGRSPPEMTRPCTHNAWDDVRTRRHAKILQCRACLAKWKLAMPVPRCSYFLHGHCDKGDTCHMLHVYKKKAEKEKDRQPTEPPVAPRNEKEDRNLADSVKTAQPNVPTAEHQWRNYFPEDDVNYLARSEGGTKYGIVQLKELKDELSNRRTQRNQNIVQYIQQSSDAHMQHVLVSLVQQQGMPSPTSSGEPPSLMSPASCAPATPITSSGIPMGPPSPINQQDAHPISAQQTSVAVQSAVHPKDRSLAVRRGFVQPVASSNPPYYGCGIATPTTNGGPVSLENQRQMSMPSLVATPMGTEMLGTPGCHSPHSPLANGAPMGVPSPTGIYGSEMIIHEEAPPPYTLLAGNQSTQSHQPAPEEIEKQRMIAMASGFAISSGAQPISDIHSHASRHTNSPCNLISPICQSPSVQTPNCISPVAGCVSPMSNCTSEAIKSPVQRENEGVHAMTEDELDAHIAKWEKRATPKAC